MRLRLVAPVFAGLIISTLVSPAQADSSVTIVAVGDVARAGGAQAKTAALTKNLKPSQVLLIGDLAYQKGSDKEFKKYFLPAWKQILSKSWAVPGNHEYGTTNAAGYRNVITKYSMPSTDGNLWWVKQTSNWSVIGLDSEALTGDTGTKQLSFLRQALLENDGRPTIVTWHRPTFSRGYHGDQTDTQQIWDLVSADKDVKLVLWGHDHNYEQVERTIASGTANEHKVNTIVVGTGGADLRACNTPNIPGELICGKKNNYGVLELTLNTNSYSWSFQNVNGKKLGKQLDSGSVTFN
jgi:predicted phosphodiesterase